MADIVTIGSGTTIAYGVTNQTSSYGTPIAKITNFTPSKTTVQKVTIDTFDAVLINGLPVEDCIPGWISPGTYAIKLFSVASIVNTLTGMIGTQHAWKVVKPDLSGYKFEAYIAEVGEEFPLKEGIELTVTMQINKGTVATFATVET